jgi:hypothetical protein
MVDPSTMTTRTSEGDCAHAPILLSTSSSFCPFFDATRASNAWLRCASGSRASRTSITTSALSSTAARCGRSGLRSSGVPLASAAEAEAEADVPLVAGVLLLDLDGLFVGSASVATPSKSPSPSSASSLPWSREPSSPLSFVPVSRATFCCARIFFFSSFRRAFASAACAAQPVFLSLQGDLNDGENAPVFVPLLSPPKSDLYMENYSGCQGLLVSLTEQGIRRQNAEQSVNGGERTRFPGGVPLRCLPGLFLALPDFVLDTSALGGCAPPARLWAYINDMFHTTMLHTYFCVSWALFRAQRESAPSTKEDSVCM